MSVKSKVVDNCDCTEKKPEFPALYKHFSGTKIVLFTSAQTGMVVQGDNVGSYTKDGWVPCHRSDWTRLNGQVILEND